jgi:hypothetical protein
MKGSSRAEPLRQAISSFLAERGWEVMGHNIEGPLDEVLKEAGVKVEDEATWLGMQIGSDVRLAFEGKLTRVTAEGKQRLLFRVQAYEPSTSRMLAEASAVCEPVASESADTWRRACEKVLIDAEIELRRRVRPRAVQVPHHTVVFLQPPKKLDFKMHSKLKRLCGFSSATHSTKALASFHVHCDLSRDQLADKISLFLGQTFPGSTFDIRKVGTKVILVVFN